MTSANQSKILFLDWHRTLSTSLFWGHTVTSTDPYLQQFRSVGRILFSELNSFIEPWMRGRYTAEEICAYLAPHRNVPPHQLLEELKRSCETVTLVDERISELLHQLKRENWTCVIATDNMDSFTRWTYPYLEQTSRCVDGFLNSYDLGALKTDIAGERSLFFSKFLEARNLKPNDCVMIDNDKTICETLRAIGFDCRHSPTPGKTTAHLESLLK